MYGSLIATLICSVLAATKFDVVVGENIRVSQSETPYVEPYIVVHPTIDGQLLAVATPLRPCIFLRSG